MQTDTYFLSYQRIFFKAILSNVDTYYQLCTVIDLSLLKVKNPSVDSMSMFPALPYTDN